MKPAIVFETSLDYQRALDKVRQDAFIGGLYLGFCFGGLFAMMVMYLFGTPIKGALS